MRCLQRVAAFQRLLVGQARDAVARPQAAQRRPRPGASRASTAQLLAVRAVGAAGLRSIDAALGLAAPLAEHDHRALAEHVGQRARLDVVHVEAVEAAPSPASAPGDSIIRRKRAACSRGLHRVGDDEGLALPARARPSIRCRLTERPMPKANTLACAEVPAHQLEGFALDRHVAVGHDDHAARHVGAPSARRRRAAAPASARCCRRRCSLLDRLRAPARCWRAWPAPTAATASGCCPRTAAR